MIIDLLQKKKHKIITSGFTGVDDVDFTTSSTPNTWKVITNSDQVSFTITGIDKSFIKDITSTISGTYGIFTISYSLDNINWFELPYKEYTSARTLTRLTSKSGSGVASSWEYLNLITNEYETETVSSGSATSYTFNSYNQVSKLEEPLYTNFDFISLRFDIFGVIASAESPLYFSSLEIFVDEFITDSLLDDYVVELRAESIFPGKLYEEQPFLLDVTKTYLKMLESEFREPDYNTTQTRNPNDFYRQLVNIQDNLSIDNTNNNDFTFTPTIYNVDKNRYEDSDTDINVTNNLNYINLQVNQYAIEYRALIDSINALSNNQLNTNLYTESVGTAVNYKNNFIKMLLKNINKLNHLKGSLYLIEYVLKVYAKFLGYNVISVVEEKNFVYRISASIPKAEWESVLKDIVHPCGWNVLYNYIPSPGDLEIELGSLSNHIGRYFKSTGTLECTSYLEGDYLNRNKTIRKLHSLRPGFLPDQTIDESYIENNFNFGTFFEDNQYVDDYTDSIDSSDGYMDVNYLTQILPKNGPYQYKTKYAEKKLNINNAWESKATVNTNYSNQGFDISDVIFQRKNYNFVNDRIGNTYNINFGQPGIALQYIWKTYLGNTLVKTIVTPTPKYILDLTSIGTSNNYRTELTLKHQTWEQTIFGFRRNYDQYRTLPRSFNEASFKNKLLNVIASNLQYESNSGIALESFTSEYLHTSVATINDISYVNLPTSAGSPFVLAFDTLANFNVEDTVIGTQTRFDIEFKKPGFATKYIWNIYNDGILERSITTYSNIVSFNVNTVPNMTLELMLSKYEFLYTLTTSVQLIA